MKNILITGATSGIGYATSRILAQAGYNLILCGRRLERLNELKEVLKKDFNSQIYLLNFDVRNFNECQTSVDSLPAEFKNIDVLINNAGLALGLDSIESGNIDHWNTMWDTNVKGLSYMTRIVSSGMIERQQGQIINIGSIAGKETYPKGNMYCASKFAVDAITKSTRQDLYSHNIRVSQICPGHVEDTEFALNRFEGNKDKARIYNDFNPLKASDIGEIILFVISTPAHVTIQDLIVTGTQQASAVQINRNGRTFDPAIETF
ncbi:MAG: SDR family NAD(P)-dependent oxidoreductase [Saprospiraceae bacterium]|nr:SDR family NAD(P)-dependent oxidoreductase [Saprospiraceae bacterium]